MGVGVKLGITGRINCAPRGPTWCQRVGAAPQQDPLAVTLELVCSLQLGLGLEKSPGLWWPWASSGLEGRPNAN